MIHVHSTGHPVPAQQLLGLA